MSAMIYGLPRSFCLESWAAALFMTVSHKSAPGAGSSSAQEDEDGGKGDGGEGAQSLGSSEQESDPCSLVLSVWCVMTPSPFVYSLVLQ